MMYIYKRKCWLCFFQVIARIVDGSKFDEFKTMYGETLVTGEPDGNVNSLFLFQKKMWLTGTMHITKGWSSYTLASLSCNKIRVEWSTVYRETFASNLFLPLLSSLLAGIQYIYSSCFLMLFETWSYMSFFSSKH